MRQTSRRQTTTTAPTNLLLITATKQVDKSKFCIFCISFSFSSLFALHCLNIRATLGVSNYSINLSWHTHQWCQMFNLMLPLFLQLSCSLATKRAKKLIPFYVTKCLTMAALRMNECHLLGFRFLNALHLHQFNVSFLSLLSCFALPAESDSTAESETMRAKALTSRGASHQGGREVFNSDRVNCCDCSCRAAG